MTYPMSFTPDQKMILNEFLPQVEKMKPGGIVTVEHKNSRELERRRYLLYAWLSPFHSNLKELYSVKSISANAFVVIRKDTAKAVVKTMEEDSCALFVMEHLLEVVDEQKALEVIYKNCSNASEQERIFNEWKRING